MTLIISEERFKSQGFELLESYKALQQKFPKDVSFKKVGRSIRTLRSLYGRDKVYAVRQLNYLEKAQIAFDEERRALIVRAIELLQKLILHKKLNQEKSIVVPKKRIPPKKKT